MISAQRAALTNETTRAQLNALRDLNNAAHQARRIFPANHAAFGRVLVTMRETDALVDEFGRPSRLHTDHPRPEEIADLRTNGTIAGLPSTPRARRNVTLLAISAWVLGAGLVAYAFSGAAGAQINAARAGHPDCQAVTAWECAAALEAR